jgi:hypothetical protein
MHTTSGHLHHEEHVQAAQGGSTVHMGETAASMLAAFVRRNGRHGVRSRWGAGWTQR